MNNLLNNVEIVVVEAAATAGQTTLTTDVIDMAGWTGVMFVAHLGDVSDGSVLSLTAHHSDNSNGSSDDDLEDPIGLTAGAANADNTVLALDVVRPEKRYVFAKLARGSANAVVNGIIAYKYGPRRAPVTQGATVIDSGTLANPEAAA